MPPCPHANMSQSDSKYGNETQTGSGYSSFGTSKAERYGRRLVMTFLDFRHANAPDNLEVKWFPVLSWTVSKVKVVSFLLGLTLTFLIMASYVLTWDRKGLFTLPPYQVRPVAIPTGKVGSELSSEKNFIDMKLLAKRISSKLEYTPRKVPDEEDVTGTDSRLFSVIPRQFLPGVKSPCWHAEFSSKPGADPYRRSPFMFSKTFRAACDHLRRNFSRHLYSRGGKRFRLRCLPYFYIVGQPKCGTTDLFRRLLLHPEVKFNTIKEPHWWTRKRFGYIRFKDGFKERVSLEDYLDLFDLAAHNIQEGINGNSSGDHGKLQFITGEASASTMWDNQVWSYLHGDAEEAQPPFLAQDFIHAVQPHAKIIIMLRDPTERLYSDYLYFKMANKSAVDFHQKVVESVQLFQSCLSHWSLRSCVYNTGLYNTMPVRLNLGLYIIFLLDWLTVFPQEQILIVRLEDYSANLRATIKKVFDFLAVGSLSEQMEAALTNRSMSNARRAADRRLGPMFPATRDLLREFHHPFNQKLATVLDNKAFLWRTT
ncbi:carbohydrate sulfotransferase 15-like [Genypterus blacodes]|uniref:carbohydrate sulfotransferase 15-like n=1 Tax=Genypterus blacodes TaxID=154954 RepID=UPI003F7684B3